MAHHHHQQQHQQLDDQRLLTPDPTTPTDSQPESTFLLSGAQAEAIITCNQKLQQLGINGTIKLPQICVIGDQSTGKSSLIEALSGIKVPKAERLCTQCPLAINLNSGKDSQSPWSCTISIEERYDFNPELRRRNVTKDQPFGPWEERKELRVIEFKKTEDKEAVCGLIKAAQSLVLNPDKQAEGLVNGQDMPVENTVKFSPNVIRIDVFEGSRPNLSFIDLPGVITNTGRTGDRYLVELVENLAKQYAGDENGIIMLTLPLNHDRENSKAYSLIQEEARSRTLAVLTKPDIASVQECQRCLHDLEQTQPEFEHGYHVVMMSSVPGPVMTQGRDQEIVFFDAYPWAEAPTEVRQRLGIPALSDYIRQLLFNKTAASLPENLEAITRRLEEVNAEISTLPPPPGAAEMPYKLASDLRRFDRSIGNLFVIDEDGISARNSFNTIATEFRDQIVKAKPTLILKTQAERQELLNAEGRLQKLQSKRQGSESEPLDISSGDEKPTAARTPKQNLGNPLARNRDHTHRFRLEEIRKINAQHAQSSIPNMIEPKAVEAMNRLAVSDWDFILDEFLQKVGKLIVEQVMLCMETVFSTQKHLAIYEVIQDWIKEFLDDIIAKERAAAQDVCSREQKYPLTLDAAALKTKEDVCITDRLLKRKEVRINVYNTKLDAKEGSVKKRKDPSDKDLGDDEYEMELKMSAKTRAYYEIAGTRFSDTIVQSIFSNLLPHCRERLAFDLEMHLGVQNPQEHEKIVRLMAEDPEREEHRHRLQNEANHLKEGHKYIKDALDGNTKAFDDEVEQHALTNDSVSVMATLPALSPAPTSISTRGGKRKMSSGGSHAREYPDTPTSKRYRQRPLPSNLDESTDDTPSVRRKLERSLRNVQIN